MPSLKDRFEIIHFRGALFLLC